MTAIELISIVCIILSCFVALAGWLKGRDTKIENGGEWKGTVNAKLDAIQQGVDGTSHKIDAMQATLTEHGERIRAVEESTKSAHHRLDELTEKQN